MTTIRGGAAQNRRRNCDAVSPVGVDSHKAEVTGQHASAVDKFIFGTHGVTHANIAEPRSRCEQEGMLTHGLFV